MGKTVLMRKGDKFADIFDSPETIAQAQGDGYHLCDETETAAREALIKADTDKKSNGSEILDEELDINSSNEQGKISLAGLSKADLLQFAGKKKLYDKSFKELDPTAIIPVILEKARAKVVETGLKTAEEAASLAEDELFALFDSVNP